MTGKQYNTVWEWLEDFDPAPFGNTARDYNWFVAFYNDATIRIAPAVERPPEGYEEHYGIAGMNQAGFLLVHRSTSRKEIADMAIQKVAMFKRYGAENDAWKAGLVAKGKWNPTFRTNRAA